MNKRKRSDIRRKKKRKERNKKLTDIDRNCGVNNCSQKPKTFILSEL